MVWNQVSANRKCDLPQSGLLKLEPLDLHSYDDSRLETFQIVFLSRHDRCRSVAVACHIGLIYPSVFFHLLTATCLFLFPHFSFFITTG